MLEIADLECSLDFVTGYFVAVLGMKVDWQPPVQLGRLGLTGLRTEEDCS